MLILVRKTNESIIIGESTVVTVLGVDSHGRVKLGIDAPKDVPVDRSEIRLQKEASSRNQPDPSGTRSSY